MAKHLELANCIGNPIVVAVLEPTDDAMVIHRHLQLTAKERTAARLLDSVVRCEKVGSRRRSCSSSPSTGEHFPRNQIAQLKEVQLSPNDRIHVNKGGEVTTAAPTQLARLNVARVQLFCSFEECCQEMNWRRAC